MQLVDGNLYQPTDAQSKEDFFHGTKKNIYSLFEMNTQAEAKTREMFRRNTDHGLEHEYNVYAKAIEIADQYEAQTGIKIRRELIYIMAIFHDSMRSIKYSDDDRHAARREKRNDRNHERYGAILFEECLERATQKGYSLDISDEDKADVIEYLQNHDYFSKTLNGGRYHEPSSIEGQIVRLADRISVSLKDEINRYRDTGKRLGTPFFHSHIPFEQRKNTSFDRMGEYFKKGEVDEVLFFIAMLLITKDDFQEPLLGDIYTKRAVQKKDAVAYIMEIADAEGASQEDRAKLEVLLTELGQIYGF